MPKKLIFFFFFKARNGNVEILSFLKSKKCDLNVKENKFGLTPLMIAISMKHWDAVQFLLPLSDAGSLNTVLLSICEEGNLELVKLLIQHGANIECVDSIMQMTPLHWGGAQGLFSIFKTIQ